MGALDLDTKFYLHDGNLTVGRFQDCTQIVENTKAMHNEGYHGSSDMKLAAKLPFVSVEKYCNDNGLFFSEVMQDPKHIRAMLNDPDLKAFRVWPGRV